MTEKKPAKKRLKKKSVIDKKKVTRRLMVKLSQKELLEHGRRIADSAAAIVEIEAEQKESMQGFKARTEEKKAAIAMSTGPVRTGKEERDVQCEQRLNYKKGTVTVIRLDINKNIEARKMSEAEKQRELHLV